jgi:NAD(P)-dependent dehydrogenase (short-subunit alcohol dehydrogenase family)
MSEVPTYAPKLWPGIRYNGVKEARLSSSHRGRVNEAEPSLLLTAPPSSLVGFTQSLAQELGPHKINVNAICPGLVDTERTDFIAAALAPEGESAEEYRAMMVRERSSTVPLGRIAVGDDIARTAAFLASGESDYLTGLSISVSGGTEMN